MHPIARILLLAALLTTPAWAQGDFIILAREPDADASGGSTASIWRLDERANTIVPVARLEPSGWSPTPLHPARPDLIRLQIPDAAAPRGYRVALYHIHRADWTVREIWRGLQALPAFEHDGSVYIETSDEQNKPLVRLRFPPGATEPQPLPEPFKYVCPVSNDARHHIIERHGNQYLYDAAARISRPIGQSNPIDGEHSRPALSADGSHLAYFAPGEVAASTESEFRLFVSLPTSGTVVLLDLRTYEEHRFEAWVYSTFSSGRIMLVGPDLAFDEQGDLNFRAIVGDQIPRGRAATSIPASEPLGLVHHSLDSHTKDIKLVPPAEAVERPRDKADDGHDTAWAFLRDQGIDAARPTAWMSTKVGFTENRARFLLRCSDAVLNGTFFLADTAANTLIRIQAPPELIRANDLNIVHSPGT